MEDGQFLDLLSWGLLMEMTRRLRPFFLVMAFRPGFPGAGSRAQQLRAEDGFAHVTLGPLRESEVQELAARKLGSTLPESFWEQAKSAEGHPLIVSEMVRLWRNKTKIDSGGSSRVPSSTPSPNVGPNVAPSVAPSFRLDHPRGSDTEDAAFLGAGLPSGTSLLGRVLRSRLDSTSMSARLAAKVRRAGVGTHACACGCTPLSTYVSIDPITEIGFHASLRSVHTSG